MNLWDRHPWGGGGRKTEESDFPRYFFKIRGARAQALPKVVPCILHHHESPSHLSPSVEGEKNHSAGARKRRQRNGVVVEGRHLTTACRSHFQPWAGGIGKVEGSWEQNSRAAPRDLACCKPSTAFPTGGGQQGERGRETPNFPRANL